MEELLEKINEKLEKLEAMEEQGKRIETKIDLFQKELQNVKDENQKLIIENGKLKQQVIEQNKRIEMLDKEVRRKKIVIKGIEEAEEESRLMIQEKIRCMLRDMGISINIEGEISEIKRIGQVFQGRKGPRPVLVEFVSWNKKMEVLKASNTLKGSEIWISGDYTKQVQEQRKFLIQRMKEARAKGYSATIKQNDLIVNGERYTIKQLENLKGDNNTEGKGTEEMKKKGRTSSQRSPINATTEERPEKTIKISGSSKNY